MVRVLGSEMLSKVLKLLYGTTRPSRLSAVLTLIDVSDAFDANLPKQEKDEVSEKRHVSRVFRR